MTYNLGIDIGIASTGFAAIDVENQRILACNSFIFEAAENPENGASLAKPRRDARGQRRVIRRSAKRKKAIRRLLQEYGFSDSAVQGIDEKHKKGSGKGDGNAPETPWDLRKQALERKLLDAEFARILFHIAKHRGFQSNRKQATSNDAEGKKALMGAIKLQEEMAKSDALTIGAYLADQPKKRNDHNSYNNFVVRDLLRSEVRQIFSAQRKFGSKLATAELEYAYGGSGLKSERYSLTGDGVAFYQRPLQSSIHMIGDCTFGQGKRAPKFSYTAELFVLWQKLNNCRIKDNGNNERPLTADEKNILSNLAHKNKSGVSYSQARKALNISDNERFNTSYRKLKDSEDSFEKIRSRTEKSLFMKLTGYHTLKEKLNCATDLDWQNWLSEKRPDLDEISRILSFYEDEKEIRDLLDPIHLTNDQISNLMQITTFKGTVDLSLTAINGILPFLQQGMTYDKACSEAGYDFKNQQDPGFKKIPPFDDIHNPVVNRALSKARKVINAVIERFGMPENIIIELSRSSPASPAMAPTLP